VSGFIEEDAFQIPFGSWKPTDWNYTFGYGVQWTGGRIDRFLLNRPLVLVDHAVGHLDHTRSLVFASGMLHLGAFTPESIWVSHPVVVDRPWACLVGWTGRRVYPTTEDALSAELTIGTLGSLVCKGHQRALHAFLRWVVNDSFPRDPKGWDTQVLRWYPTGIPTARIALQYQRVMLAQDGSNAAVLLPSRSPFGSRTTNRHFELVAGIEGQAGYYTEADPNLAIRIGNFGSPFWSLQPSPLGGSSTVAFDGAGGHSATEWFVFGVGRERLIQYNALLTGYGFHDTTVYEVAQQNIAHRVAEGVYGGSILHRWTGGQLAVTYIAGAVRSHDFNTIPRFQHRYVWGGLFVTLRVQRKKPRSQ
jgi:hypothetical protein